MQKVDVVILGAGAAGLMCAIKAGQRGRKVLLLDHADQVGSKILISGGGRCNFTNLHVAPDRYISTNPHFCRSALSQFTQQDFIALIDKHNIAYHEKTLGQLFCDRSAQQIIDMLLAECSAGNVAIHLNEHINEITKTDSFHIHTDNDLYEAPALVLATGGLSIPKMGATGLAHQIARQFDLPLTQTRPALVPLTFSGDERALMSELSGLSLEVIASIGKRAFRESMIFTHRGLSGPAILQISSHWREGNTLSLNLLPDTNAENFLLARKKARPNAELKTILGEALPQRLAQSLTESYFTNAPIGTLTDKTLRDVAALLNAWKVTPTGTEGYAKAEVTLGGVDTRALSSKTMESTKVAGLYVIGEAVDVTGWLGGYNFQWAWSSGWAAGSAV
ncbi:MAG: NAD(P)/FAD-dependent oxidoreductase [Alphaproteobacteria bacterium]|nr:NAD(P)/FAD-dependent oxidoreductase [Alphaproteobacteria bacterium]